MLPLVPSSDPGIGDAEVLTRPFNVARRFSFLSFASRSIAEFHLTRCLLPGDGPETCSVVLNSLPFWIRASSWTE